MTEENSWDSQKEYWILNGGFQQKNIQNVVLNK